MRRLPDNYAVRAASTELAVIVMATLSLGAFALTVVWFIP